MDTINIVLMIVLSAIIGFAAGNAWGKETMRRLYISFIDHITDGMKATMKKKED